MLARTLGLEICKDHIQYNKLASFQEENSRLKLQGPKGRKTAFLSVSNDPVCTSSLRITNSSNNPGGGGGVVDSTDEPVQWPSMSLAVNMQRMGTGCSCPWAQEEKSEP